MKIKGAFAGIVAGLIVLFAPVTSDAAPAPVKASGTSVCETGGRGDADYRRLCMTPGTIPDAAELWFSVPRGVKGKEVRDGYSRRSVCKFAREFGGIRAAAADLFYDVTYDNYTRDAYVRGWIGTFAAHDCKAMGYRV